MNMNIVKFAKAAAVLALVVSGGAHAGTSSKGVAKQLAAVSKTRVAAQPNLSLSDPDLVAKVKAALAVASPEQRAAYKAQAVAYVATATPAQLNAIATVVATLPPEYQTYIGANFPEVPVSPS